MKPLANSFMRPCVLTSLFVLTRMTASAAPLYWDGTGTWPAGTWGTDNFWSASSSGGSPGAWVDGSDAVFSAGTSAIGTYTVTLGNAISAVTLAVEEGSPTLSAASATTLSLAGTGSASPWASPTINVVSGSSLSVGNNTALSLTGSTDHYVQGGGSITIGGTGASLSTTSGVANLAIDGTGTVVTVNTGGTLSQTNTAAGGRLYLGVAGVGTKLVVNGGAVSIAGGTGLVMGQNAGAKGIVELNSGTITTQKVSKGTNGSAEFKFNGGTLKAGVSSTSFWANSTGTTALVESGGGVIDTNGYNITIAQVLTGSGALSKNGAGQLTLSGANTFSGGFSLDLGTALVGANSTTSGTSVTNGVFGTGNLTLKDGSLVASSSSSSRLIAAPQIVLKGNVTMGWNTTLTGRLQVAGVWDLDNGSRTVTLGKASTSWASGQEVVTFSKPTDFLDPKVQNGSLTFSTATGSASTPSIVRIGSTTNFDSNAALTLDDGVAMSSGTSNFFGTGANAPKLTLNAASSRGGGVLQLADGNTAGTAIMRNAHVYSLAGGGTIKSDNIGAGATTSATGTLTINHGGGQNFSGNITESALGKIAVTKSGAGTQTLSGTNTYTGATSVNGGTLVIGTGGSLGNTALTVGGSTASGTPTLAGGGTINGATTIAAASGGVVGTHSVGVAGVSDGVGTQTFASTLAYGTGSIFEWSLQAVSTTDPGAVSNALTGTYDKVVATGSSGSVSGSGAIFKIVLGGNAFTDVFWNSNKTWTDIFSGAGAPTNLASIFSGGFSGTNVNTDGTVTGNGGHFSFNGSSTLTWTAVPEPSSALAGLLITAGLLRRRRSA